MLLEQMIPNNPPMAVVARSTPRHESLFENFILWLCLIIGRPVVSSVRQAIASYRRERAALTFLASVLFTVGLEIVAQNCLEKGLGALC